MGSLVFAIATSIRCVVFHFRVVTAKLLPQELDVVVVAVDIDDAPPTCVMRGIEGARLTHQTSACAQYYCGGPLWGSRPKFGACRHLVPV